MTSTIKRPGLYGVYGRDLPSLDQSPVIIHVSYVEAETEAEAVQRARKAGTAALFALALVDDRDPQEVMERIARYQVGVQYLGPIRSDLRHHVQLLKRRLSDLGVLNEFGGKP